MTQAKQKAIELVKSFKDFVNPYMGEGIDNSAILFQCKKCAHVCVNAIIESGPSNPNSGEYYELFQDRIDEVTAFYGNVRNNIDLVTVEDIFEDGV